MKVQLGPAAPTAGSAETEALRRYRSFLCSALVHGETAPPALDGLRIGERRVMALIQAWTRAAEQVRGESPADLPGQVGPWTEQFRTALRQSAGGRTRRGQPQASRRAVVAAIDRVADAFLAIDTDTGEIVDANPAAGALLGIDRDALLGVDSLRFVSAPGHDGWWNELDAMGEDGDTRGFAARLLDTRGEGIEVDAKATRFNTKGRVLALLMLRPRGASPGRATATPAGLRAPQ